MNRVISSRLFLFWSVVLIIDTIIIIDCRKNVHAGISRFVRDILDDFPGCQFSVEHWDIERAGHREFRGRASRYIHQLQQEFPQYYSDFVRSFRGYKAGGGGYIGPYPTPFQPRYDYRPPAAKIVLGEAETFVRYPLGAFRNTSHPLSESNRHRRDNLA